MLLVSSPGNFLPCGGSSYCCKSDALAKKYEDRYITIDASGTKWETHNKIISALKEKGIVEFSKDDKNGSSK